MNCIKDVFEIAYYVAFIILTFLIVKYTRKTFLLQSEKSHSILCKLNVMGYKDHYHTEFGVEVYNYGNDVAKDLIISVENEISFTCDYIKPNESVIYPLGIIIHTIEENHVQLNATNERKEVPPQTPLNVTVTIDGEEKTYQLSTDLLFSIMGGPGFSEIVRSIDRVSSEIRNSRR